MIERKERVEGGRWQIVLSDPTYDALDTKPGCDRLEPALVKGRQTAVGAYRMGTAAA